MQSNFLHNYTNIITTLIIHCSLFTEFTVQWQKGKSLKTTEGGDLETRRTLQNQHSNMSSSKHLSTTCPIIALLRHVQLFLEINIRANSALIVVASRGPERKQSFFPCRVLLLITWIYLILL